MFSYVIKSFYVALKMFVCVCFLTKTGNYVDAQKSGLTGVEFTQGLVTPTGLGKGFS